MLFEKKKKVKSSRESSQIKKLSKLKGESKLPEDTLTQINDIIRDYLKTKFKLPLSLTHEEVIKKLQEKKINKLVKIDLSRLLMQVYGKEYFPHNTLDQNSIEFLIDLSIKTLKEVESNKQLEVEKPKKEEKGIIVSNKSPEIIKLESDIASIGDQTSIDWGNETVRTKYDQIRQDYSNLSDNEKKTMYPQIISLFKIEK